LDPVSVREDLVNRRALVGRQVRVLARDREARVLTNQRRLGLLSFAHRGDRLCLERYHRGRGEGATGRPRALGHVDELAPTHLAVELLVNVIDCGVAHRPTERVAQVVTLVGHGVALDVARQRIRDGLLPHCGGRAARPDAPAG
jgi:hypothetical protein